jgi:hypothetical protein
VKNNRTIISGAIGLALLGIAAGGFWAWYTTQKEKEELQAIVASLQKQEMKSSVLQSVSKQMEEIAYQQKAISDEQREEALQQTKIANEMREQSEVERQNAIAAKKVAMESEKKALDAFDQAEQQRQMAEHQRLQAELSKRVADTLSYVALGRSLGSLAITQYRVGNKDLATLLSYAAYYFTNKYNGDIYNPMVYQALSLASQSRREWSKHSGATMNVDFISKDDNKFVTVSNYGEMIQHELAGNDLKSTTLFENSDFDFRDVYANEKTGISYALSRTGQLVVNTSKGIEIQELKGLVRPFKLSALGENTLIVAENAMALYDIKQNKVVAIRPLSFRPSYVSKTDKMPVMFDNSGKMHYVITIDSLVTKKVPVPGRVSAYNISQSGNREAFGMDDGTLFVVNKRGAVQRLVGHRSRISKLRFYNHRLYSSSFDGTLNFWELNLEKPEPMTLYSGNCWIMHFAFDKSRSHVWIGDQKGNVAEVLVSVPVMVERIRKMKAMRNLTESEWIYYIGRNIPYVSFLTGKEVKR